MFGWLVGAEYERDVLMLDVRGVTWRGFKGWEVDIFLSESEYGVGVWGFMGWDGI